MGWIWVQSAGHKLHRHRGTQQTLTKIQDQGHMYVYSFIFTLITHTPNHHQKKVNQVNQVKLKSKLVMSFQTKSGQNKVCFELILGGQNSLSMKTSLFKLPMICGCVAPHSFMWNSYLVTFFCSFDQHTGKLLYCRNVSCNSNLWQHWQFFNAYYCNAVCFNAIRCIKCLSVFCPVFDPLIRMLCLNRRGGFRLRSKRPLLLLANVVYVWQHTFLIDGRCCDLGQNCINNSINIKQSVRSDKAMVTM